VSAATLRYKKSILKALHQLTASSRPDMTCFRLGSNGTLSASTTSTASYTRPQASSQRPLVEFSPRSQDRANLMSIGSSSGSSLSSGQRRRRRRTNTLGKLSRKGRRKRTRVSKIRVVKGRVALRVSGRPGVQHIGAGQLVRFVPINKLRAAAQRVLNQSVAGRRRRGGRIKKKSRRRRRRQRR